mgnify:CR=1 FL=1
MIDLKDTNVILTGATGGIGNSILENLILTGANVLATGTNEHKLNLIKEKYNNVQTEKFDISNHSEIENFINKANDSLGGRVDVLINNAGITRDNLSIRMKNEEWNKNPPKINIESPKRTKIVNDLCVTKSKFSYFAHYEQKMNMKSLLTMI